MLSEQKAEAKTKKKKQQNNLQINTRNIFMPMTLYRLDYVRNRKNKTKKKIIC